MNKIPIYPISFENNICPHCANKSLVYKDQYNKTTKEPFYPVSFIFCKECKTEFYIKWEKKGNEYISHPISFLAIDEFEKDVIDIVEKYNRKLPL